MDPISVTIAAASTVIGLASLAIAGRANQIARNAVDEAHAQTQTAQEALIIAREAHELAQRAQQTAEHAHLVNEFADADRALAQWQIEVPDRDPWLVVVTEHGSKQVRDLSVRLCLDDTHTLERHLDHMPREGVAFDVAEVAQELLTQRRGHVHSPAPIQIRVRCAVEWRGRSPKALTTQRKDRFDYPGPVPRCIVI